MNTPAHLLFGTAFFAKAGRPHVTLAAVIGSLLPDLSLYLMVATSIWGLGITPARVFDELYFSDAWQAVFAIDNSFPLWALVLVVALWRKRPAWVAFAAAGLLHLICDFALHHDDARRMFWPISDWVFHSPLSYWDQRHHAGWIAPLELLLSLICAIILFRRFRAWPARVATAAVLMAEIVPELLFRYML